MGKMNLLQMLVGSINTIYTKYLKDDEILDLPIYYIGGAISLPPPLSAEEEAELLRKLEEGKIETSILSENGVNSQNINNDKIINSSSNNVENVNLNNTVLDKELESNE